MAFINFDPKKLIRCTLIANGVFFSITLIQYFFIPLFGRILMFDFYFLSSLMLVYIILSFIGAKYQDSIAISLTNSLLLFVGFAVFGYISLFFNGFFNGLLLLNTLPLTILNLCSFIVNVRAQFKHDIGTAVVMILFFLISVLLAVLIYPSLINYVALLFPAVIVSLALAPIVKNIANKITNARKNRSIKEILSIKRIFNLESFHLIRNKENRKKIMMVASIISAIFFGLVMGAYMNFGKTIRIKAGDNFKTISSYWGPPSLRLTEWNSKITAIDNNTLQIDNSTLELMPPNFRNGTLAYVTKITVNNNTGSYCNYSAGARSYPNGTVFLSSPLENLTAVNVTFKYVYNNIVLEYLNISQSTLVMNYHGDFIYYNNTFERIQSTYLFQLLDYWSIKFYLDISNGKDFPHVWNYLDSIPFGYDTLNWAHGKWRMFMGISYDFEPGDAFRKGQNPGNPEFRFTKIIGNETKFDRDLQKSWVSLNEQNHTYFKMVTDEYEKLYKYGSDLGYKTYITLGLGEIMDNIDRDIDFTRCPVDPLSPNPNVLYGHMLYQDNNFNTGRFRVYQGCTDQIKILGNQGKTILLGWLANGTRYYTDDEIGLQRYIEDCKIAQASGMEEIFHAPLYRMQSKWGDEAILRLHKALNEDSKKEIVIPVPVGLIDQNLLSDFLKNFNYIWLGLPMFLIIPIGYFGFYKKVEKSIRNP